MKLYITCLLAALTSALFWVNTSGAAVLHTNCVQESEPTPYRYCVFRTEGSRNPDILYYFHGLNMNAEAWGSTHDFPQLLREHWDRLSFEPPTVVSISFGGDWLLVPRNSSSKSGLYEVVTQTAIPLIESRMGGLAQGQRLMIGESMGGFNGLQVLLRNEVPFGKVAILYPPVATVSPYAPVSEIRDYIARTGANLANVFTMLFFSRQYIPSDDEWRRVSPFTLVRSFRGRPVPRTEIYLSAAYRDEYGVYEGTAELESEMRTLGMNVYWQPLYGRHGAVDIRSLAEFIAEE